VVQADLSVGCVFVCLHVCGWFERNKPSPRHFTRRFTLTSVGEVGVTRSQVTVTWCMVLRRRLLSEVTAADKQTRILNWATNWTPSVDQVDDTLLRCIIIFINFSIARPTYCFILMYTCGLSVVSKRIYYCMLCYLRLSIASLLHWSSTLVYSTTASRGSADASLVGDVKVSGLSQLRHRVDVSSGARASRAYYSAFSSSAWKLNSSRVQRRMRWHVSQCDCSSVFKRLLDNVDLTRYFIDIR